MDADLDVAVVGAGPAGLAVAYALQKAGRSVHVFEAADRVGGRMRTLRHDGYVIDEGADMISTCGCEATWKLIHELGVPLADIPRLTNLLAMWRAGTTHRYVAHPLGLLTGAGLSLRARLDLLRFIASVRRKHAFDPDHPENTPLGEMTIAQLAGRYRRELHDYLFQPVVGGFFGWDTDRSSAAAFAAHLRATGTALHWRTYRDGMDTLCCRIAERLQVSTRSPVREVISAPTSARVVTDHAVLTARSVVLSVPAPAALDLHVNAPQDERPYLEACTFVPRLKVSCLLDRPIAPRSGQPLYAMLFPAVENPVLVALTLDHNKCPGRAPEGHGLVILFASLEATRELIDAPDEEVVRTLTEEGEHYLPGLCQATRVNFVHRFRHGMPEATPTALRLRSGFMRRATRAVEYAGDWVLLRPCSEGAIRSASLAAARLLGAAPTPATSVMTDVGHDSTGRD